MPILEKISQPIMMIHPFLTALAFSVGVHTTSAAYAGKISPTGSTIEVESYRCEVTSERSIQCRNIGRVCENARAEEKQFSDTWRGCALWTKDYPTTNWCPEKWKSTPDVCIPTLYGGW